ncbi:DNA ligase D [Sphingosinicella sp. BN140058]|uniref:DNA ligase D n=1 Tax=Sphingosinicella sp. BN140058 TaxID=1892855 RepID=UPI0010123837|nr:DNA ligase D [Sphingosinicella sp. BN140058]QAY75164.1 DNA ligase D [Sphingosinicella sp. BN140058]
MAKPANPLETYNQKRDFAKTAEPKGTFDKLSWGEGHGFMVQKHDATRLHYDFRLELDGVLKSWAVPNGPSLDPADKRLAVRTEDHPLSYATFEGIIPKGEYGGGTVMLWDRGIWIPHPGKDPRKTLEEGHLHFTLDGERMQGEWIMIRMKGRPRDRGENWILKKVTDEHAGGSMALTERFLTSIKTGRTMQEIAAEAKAKELKSWLKGLEPKKNPPRALLGKGGVGGSAGRGPAESRNRLQSSRQSKTGGGANGAGAPPQGAEGATSAQSAPPPRRSAARSPSPSKARGGGGQGALPLPAFREPRKATLADHVPSGSGWIHEMKYDGYRCLLAIAGGKAKVYTRSGLDWSDKFPEIVDAAASLEVGSALLDGEIVSLDDKGSSSFSALQQAIGEGGRGLTLFLFDALEIDGEDVSRLPNIERKGRLATLVGEGKPPILLYAEHIVGHGEELFRAMCDAGQEGIISKRADASYRSARTKTWLKIKCIQRQEFVIIGWTPSEAKARGFRSLLLAVNEDGALRYVGKVGTGFSMALIQELLARLKRIEVKTAPTAVPRAEALGAHWVKSELVCEIAFAEFTSEGVIRHGSFLGLRGDKKAGEVVRELPQPIAEPSSDDIKITNPERVIFPDAGVTKQELVDYYRAIGPVMMAWAAQRPLSLVRCPQGRDKKCFFQKHNTGSFGRHVHQIEIEEKKGQTEDYVYVDDTAGLIACVQMGTIEFHGWGSPVADIEKPDRLIFDIDPDEGLDFAETKRAARDLHRYLADMGLQSFPLLTGGKGVHVVVPLTPDAEWPEVKDFAQRFCIALATAEPERFTANLAKAKRKGRMFLDYLRNQRGATAIMPYSARAREGAPVSAPISWDELDDMQSGARFSVRDSALLLERASSRALQGWGEASQTLPDL